MDDSQGEKAYELLQEFVGEVEAGELRDMNYDEMEDLMESFVQRAWGVITPTKRLITYEVQLHVEACGENPRQVAMHIYDQLDNEGKRGVEDIVVLDIHSGVRYLVDPADETKDRSLDL